MQSVEYAKLSDMIRSMEKSVTSLKTVQRRAHETLGAALLADVKQRIGGSGKVQSWQELKLGSGGGYAAVRAASNTFTAKNNAGNSYAVGAVTNAIESGHKQNKGMFVDELLGSRFWAGTSEGGARLVYNKVAGRGFYADSKKNANALAESAAKDFAAEIVAELEE